MSCVTECCQTVACQGRLSQTSFVTSGVLRETVLPPPPIPNIGQYSDKFMHCIVSHSIVLCRSLLYCIVNLLLGGYNIIQCHA